MSANTRNQLYKGFLSNLKNPGVKFSDTSLFKKWRCHLILSAKRLYSYKNGTFLAFHYTVQIKPKFLLEFILFIVTSLGISSGSLADSCISFYRPKAVILAPHDGSSLSIFKDKILEMADHPMIRDQKLTIDSKGEAVVFLKPLIEQLLKKAARLWDPKLHSDYRNTEFGKLLEELNAAHGSAEMTYFDMYSVPFRLSRFFDLKIEDAGVKTPRMKDMKWRLSQYVKRGIYPLPMGIAPDFELRTKLWATLTPPISFIAKEFYSQLDYRDFSPDENIDHDLAHAGFHLSDGFRKGEIIQMSQIPKPVFKVVDGYSLVQRKMAYYFLHDLFPEGHYRQFREYMFPSKDSRIERHSLTDSLLKGVAESLERSEPNVFFVDGDPYWSISAMGLSDQRIELHDGRYFQTKINPDTRRTEIVEGTADDFRALLHPVRKQVQSLILHEIEKMRAELR